MALRLIDMVIPEKFRKEVEESLAEQAVLDVWQETIRADRIHLKILVPTEKTSALLDLLEKRYKGVEGFRIILLAVEASIPRPDLPEDQPKGEVEEKKPEKPDSKKPVISREELYTDLEITTRFSWTFIILVILAAIVASVGVLRDNVVIIIGAMVIAPLLGPNVALSLATTLGDIKLTRRAIKTIFSAVLTVLIFSALVGVLLKVDPEIPELVSRTEVNLGDVVLALAAGCAAVLSFTSGLYSALIGVMVAVALLPPLVVLGLLLGSGNWQSALGAFSLFLTNLICINLSGVVTFLAQGVRPLTWWESHLAKKATKNAIVIWTGLLLVLIVIILIA